MILGLVWRISERSVDLEGTASLRVQWMLKRLCLVGAAISASVSLSFLDLSCNDLHSMSLEDCLVLGIEKAWDGIRCAEGRIAVDSLEYVLGLRGQEVQNHGSGVNASRFPRQTMHTSSSMMKQATVLLWEYATQRAKRFDLDT